MPRTFLATLQYDGTHFVGWQRQREGRTVQQVAEVVLARLAGYEVRAHAAGRTDAGVHAIGMGTSFTLPDRWTPESLQRAMNALLPKDCFVVEVRETRPGFHARKCATERRYEYVVGTDALAHSPFRRRYEWALGQPLDRDRLTRAATRLVGEHDFGAFSIKNSRRAHTRCRVRLAEWEARAGDTGHRFRVAADRFLQHMVRKLTRTMVDIALGRRPETDMEHLLADPGGVRAPAPAPPQGLFFIAASYPAEWFALSESA